MLELPVCANIHSMLENVNVLTWKSVDTFCILQDLQANNLNGLYSDSPISVLQN